MEGPPLHSFYWTMEKIGTFLLRVAFFQLQALKAVLQKHEAHKQRAKRSLPIESNLKKASLTAKNTFCLILTLLKITLYFGNTLLEGVCIRLT